MADCIIKRLAWMLAIPMAILFWSAAIAGENKTTWRVGDMLPGVAGFCTSHEAAAEMAATPLQSTIKRLVESGKCVPINPMMAAMMPPIKIEQFMSHHFDPMYRKNVSVWRSGKMFLILRDDGGPHEASKGA